MNVTKDVDNIHKYFIIAGIATAFALGIYLGWDYLPKPSINWIFWLLGLRNNGDDDSNNNNNNQSNREELERQVLELIKEKSRLEKGKEKVYKSNLGEATNPRSKSQVKLETDKVSR